MCYNQASALTLDIIVEDVSLTEMCYNLLISDIWMTWVEDVSLTEMCYNHGRLQG